MTLLEEAIVRRCPKAVNILLFDLKADPRLTINLSEIDTVLISKLQCRTLLHLALLGPREMNRVWESKIEEKEPWSKRSEPDNVARPRDFIVTDHYASLEIVRSLVKVVDINAKDQAGKTPLGLAIEVSGQKEINPKFKEEYDKIVKFLESQKAKKIDMLSY
jgi:hypothetical protein